MSKKQIKSNNRKKARARLARAYKRVTDMRMDNLHKITSYLAKNHGEVIIEDLNYRVC
ncbi:MAG: transposase [Pseudanabaenaceae cyanobacterium]